MHVIVITFPALLIYLANALAKQNLSIKKKKKQKITLRNKPKIIENHWGTRKATA